MDEKAVRQWCMFMHLSQFAGYLIPLAGIIAPIVMWRARAAQSEEVDEHGRMIVNAMLSFFCYWIIAIILCFVIVGIPLVIALGVASIAFPIIGAIKADEGVLWRYPMAISFL